MSGNGRLASQLAARRISHTAMRFAPPFDGFDDSGSEFDEHAPSVANSGITQSTVPRRTRQRRNMRPQDEPREVTCASCINRMDQNGPVAVCRSQESPNAVACFACAKVGRKCLPVPEAALPHAHVIQEAASRLINGEPVLNWNVLVSEAKEAVHGVRQNPVFVPNPPSAIDQGAAPSPEPSQSPQPLQQAPADDICAAVSRNNELVAKNNQLLQRVLNGMEAFARATR
ncbi:uncharacterized protein NECHADRAFT_74252 [Fusarium vanettenii 77-13-4]|uniref:Uncharacterized protein n=1 Tax=Fusarium vanettenii (strain ATCC MYA-4622 / CBS 123669 / FGSC 9596 / NRRL 45880 / 77-13-4) TaxID=660122 RepID=C7YWC1_FUSV7|nr:uncharacterized protein NECHADRAFT_74252 [Fusarium vanettenii 77-13-4]EEU44153.1 predicted protein [Fusarium vanettenii 77-13-4]